jgi:iron complex outermembrane receptor protein
MLRVALAVVFLGFGVRLGAQAVVPDSSVGALKKLSVEDLMDIEVTSVTKEPEALLDADSAIQVVTGDEINRSGATSIP